MSAAPPRWISPCGHPLTSSLMRETPVVKLAAAAVRVGGLCHRRGAQLAGARSVCRPRGGNPRRPAATARTELEVRWQAGARLRLRRGAGSAAVRSRGEWANRGAWSRAGRAVCGLAAAEPLTSLLYPGKLALAAAPLPERHFNLVWSTSVFTHLADEWADWLVELHRLLAPGGLLAASLMGESFSEEIAREPWDPDQVGMLALGHGRPWRAGGPMVLHSEWWDPRPLGTPLRDTRLPAWRSVRAGCTAPAPTRWRASNCRRARAARARRACRELRAALHQIELLNKEHDDLNAAHDRYATAYAEESKRVRELEAELTQVRGRLAELESARPPRFSRLLGEAAARLRGHHERGGD